MALAVLLSGCAQGSISGTGDIGGPREFHDAETGGIWGTVTNDQLAPIEEALVVLGSKEARTDASGRFSLTFVEPGVQLLTIAAVGYVDVRQSVEVRAGEIAEVAVQLASAGTIQDYHETFTQSGVIACAWGLAVAGDDGYYGTVCGLLPLLGIEGVDSFITDFDDPGIAPDVSGLIAETEWQTNQALGDWMFVRWWALPEPRTDQLGGGLLNVNAGPSPIRVIITPEMLENATYSGEPACADLDRCAILATHHSYADAGEPVDFTVTIQQRFDDWLTVFHGSTFPSDTFTALPDA